MCNKIQDSVYGDQMIVKILDMVNLEQYVEVDGKMKVCLNNGNSKFLLVQLAGKYTFIERYLLDAGFEMNRFDDTNRYSAVEILFTRETYNKFYRRNATLVSSIKKIDALIKEKRVPKNIIFKSNELSDILIKYIELKKALSDYKIIESDNVFMEIKEGELKDVFFEIICSKYFEYIKSNLKDKGYSLKVISIENEYSIHVSWKLIK